MAENEQYVNVMLEEYRALRNEITQRISSGTQLVGFTAAALALLAGAASKDVVSKVWVVGLGALLLGGLALYWRKNSSLIREAGGHLAGLEDRINTAVAIPASSGKPLSWETCHRQKRAGTHDPADAAGRTTPAVE